MKKLILLIPFLFILSCSSDDDSSDNVQNSNESSASLQLEGQVYKSYILNESGLFWNEGDFTFRIEEDKENYTTYGYLFKLPNDGFGVYNTLLVFDISTNSLEIGNTYEIEGVLLSVRDYNDFDEGDNFSGTVRITSIDSQNRVSGEFGMHNLSEMLDFEDPIIINELTGNFRNVNFYNP